MTTPEGTPNIDDEAREEAALDSLIRGALTEDQPSAETVARLAQLWESFDETNPGE